ncbi:type 4a pilus biogenesis protein PilO [Chromohalobacter sp. TMW 2.2308]|uniref:Type 4a pilus biogenesis protein PilO n=1 Tax=Chromohalobacter moromii TaxID=2860329 RepID=A0A9X3AYD7_9GAMM|nr:MULTISPECIES: type 4a pilus biogenesis protein PilO [Chromohalobacter]CDQ33875.1 Pilus assembly protein, PilO [Virgibacillus halodenitrificans]MCK2041190.1 type 4a pilus biogenesis protein PilO [Chromohalobacter moromii]MCK2046820.1 type 4a pilus biogenesis protein PilO [Chromohalobacter moromii]MCT8506396.1 type 4a pilus biogenesis protein PilO [Chromohalobacter moromii]MCT8513338.1 type 4a pilus biogenesis protein PilO [Chromohalobacter sp. TMW 2.2271]
MSLRSQWRQLREVEWRDLDLKEAGTWPALLQAVCLVALFLAVFWVAQWYVAAPRQDTLESLQGREDELLQEYETRAYQAANLEQMRTQMAELDTRMQALLKMLPTDTEIPALLDDISDAAQDHRLAIESIRLRSPVPQDFYIEQPFDIRVRGGYHDIAAFLSSVAALPRIVTLHDFSLSPVGDGDTLRLSLLARTYSYREEADPKAEERGDD